MSELNEMKKNQHKSKLTGEFQRLSETLQRREMVLNAINEMADTFFPHENDTFGDVISRGINLIADMMSINRVAVYRLLDNNRLMRQIYLWEHGKTADLEEELMELPDVPPVIRWLEVLKKGECIHNRAGDVAEDKAEFLSLFGIKSILFVPIISNNSIWGVITLANLNDDKYFDEDYVDLMHMAARMCASAVVRNEIEREIAEKDVIIRNMAENAPDGLTLMKISNSVVLDDDAFSGFISYVPCSYSARLDL